MSPAIRLQVSPKQAIDTLMVRGERAAMDSWDGLLALKRKLGLAEDYQPRRPGPFRLPGVAVDREIPVDSQIAAPAVRENKLNVGFRFDTEELAALQANTDFYFWPAARVAGQPYCPSGQAYTGTTRI